MSIIEINDFEIVDNPDTRIQTIFDKFIEKDNKTSEFKRKCRIWKIFCNDICNDCLQSIFRCYNFGTNEINYFVNEFKEKYSEQLNENNVFESKMGDYRHDDMQRS